MQTKFKPKVRGFMLLQNVFYKKQKKNGTLQLDKLCLERKNETLGNG